MRLGALVTLALTLLPGMAAACPTCLSTAYGDRTYNWAFLGLLLAPFAVSVAIGGVLAYVHLRRRSDERRSNISLEETT